MMMKIMTMSRRRIIILVAAIFLVGLLLSFFTDYQHHLRPSPPAKHSFLFSPGGRKLLGKHYPAKLEPNRVWGDKCSKADIVVNQGPTAPLPNGIPTYTVEIMNVCVSGCVISRIHFSCGWFSSARLINPKVFKRLRYNDCLVNGGKPLANGATLSFQYANTFRYPLSVSSISC